MATELRALVELQAAARPEAPFIIEAETGRTLAFAGLNAVSLTITQRLAAEGLTAGDSIGLLLPNAIEAVALAIGVMAAGYVATPLSLLSRRSNSPMYSVIPARNSCSQVRGRQRRCRPSWRVGVVSQPFRQVTAIGRGGARARGTTRC